MKRRDSDPLPSIPLVVAEISRLQREAMGLLDEYRWAMPASLQPTVVESAGGTNVAYSDPTGGVTEAKEEARARLRAAAKALTDAANDLAHHRRALEYLMGRVGPPSIPRGGGPRTVTRAELEESRKVQSARSARGEGWGEQ